MSNFSEQHQVTDQLEPAPFEASVLKKPITRDVLRQILDRVKTETGAHLHLHISGAHATVNVRLQSASTTSKIIDKSNGPTGPKSVGNQSTVRSRDNVSNATGASADLTELSKELSSLRAAMRSAGSLAEHDESMGHVAAAETAAKRGHGAGVRKNLKMAGTWALHAAHEVGLSVAEAAIKQAMGLT